MYREEMSVFIKASYAVREDHLHTRPPHVPKFIEAPAVVVRDNIKQGYICAESHFNRSKEFFHCHAKKRPAKPFFGMTPAIELY